MAQKHILEPKLRLKNLTVTLQNIALIKYLLF